MSETDGHDFTPTNYGDGIHCSHRCRKCVIERLAKEMRYIREAPTYELRWTAESECALKQAEEAVHG